MPAMQPRPPDPPIRGPERRQMSRARVRTSEDRKGAYDFLNLTPHERAVQRESDLRERSHVALGAGRRERERMDHAKQLGNWQVRADAQAAGMTEWELRKHRSRRALNESGLNVSPRSPVQPLQLSLLQQASEFGLSGHSYFSVAPLTAKMTGRRVPPGDAALGMGSLPDVSPNSAPAGPQATPMHVQARPKRLSAASATFGPLVASPSHYQSTPGGVSQPAAPTPAARVPVDVDLSDLSYHELVQVKAGLDVLMDACPGSDYMKPLHEQMQRFATPGS